MSTISGRALLWVAVLAVSLAGGAQAQTQAPIRPSPIFATEQASVTGAETPHPIDRNASSSFDARRFAAKASDLQAGVSRHCRGRRWNCVVTGTWIGGSAGLLLGSLLAASAQYEREQTIFGEIRKCVAHCNDKGNKAARFGIAGLIIGVGTTLYLTR